MKLSSNEAEHLAQVMQALASTSRLHILARLEEGNCCVSTLVQDCDMAQATVSTHLRHLRHLDLVKGERDGRNVIYSLADNHVREFLGHVRGHVRHYSAMRPEH